MVEASTNPLEALAHPEYGLLRKFLKVRAEVLHIPSSQYKTLQAATYHIFTSSPVQETQTGRKADRHTWVEMSGRLHMQKGSFIERQVLYRHLMMRAFLDNCTEVTHCIPVASEPVEVGCFGKDEPVSRVLDKLVIGVSVAVGDGQGGSCHVGAWFSDRSIGWFLL